MTISWEEGCDIIDAGIAELLTPELLTHDETVFSFEAYLKLDKTINEMCKAHMDYISFPRKLFQKYKESLEHYTESVLALHFALDPHDELELVLKHLKIRWTAHQTRVVRFSHFFRHIDTFHDYGYKRKAIVEDSLQKLKVRHHELLSVYATRCCHTLLRDGKKEDLSRMYAAFSGIPEGLKLVANIFSEQFLAEFQDLINQANRAAIMNKLQAKEEDTVGVKLAFVEKTIELKEKYYAFVMDCFKEDESFRELYWHYARSFFNFSEPVAYSSCTELLATYCDNVLKKAESKDNEKTRQKVLGMFQCIETNEKRRDLFLSSLRSKIAHWLLFSDKIEDDTHRYVRSLIARMGSEFSFPELEGMVDDMALVRENKVDFDEYLKSTSRGTQGFDLTVTALSSCNWPKFKSFDLHLPAEMGQYLEAFHEFYQKKRRMPIKLYWLHSSQHRCTILGKFEENTLEMVVSTAQAATLLLFNESKKMSYQDILTRLKLSDEEGRRVLYSLSCAKYKILKKKPDNKDIFESDVFELNTKFTHPTMKIKIPCPSLVGPIEDVESAIDMSIAQIMKARKVLSHKDLCDLTIESLARFKLKLVGVAVRVDKMIKMGFLAKEGEGDNPRMLTWLEPLYSVAQH